MITILNITIGVCFIQSTFGPKLEGHEGVSYCRYLGGAPGRVNSP